MSKTNDKNKPITAIQSSGAVQVKGRGTVYLVDAANNPGIDFRRLVGATVSIFGSHFVVTGVECISKNGIVQDSFGLVVRSAERPK